MQNLILKFFSALWRINEAFFQQYKRLMIRIKSPNVQIDSHTRFGRHVTIRAIRGAKIDIRGAIIKDYCYVYADSAAVIRIGREVEVGRFSMIVAKENITIEDTALIAEFVTIRDQDHDLSDLKKFVTSPVHIAGGSWIGNKVTITKGVSIGSGAVIGANSVVTKSVPDRAVAVGAPARIIRYL